MPILDALKQIATGAGAGLASAAGSPYAIEELQRKKQRRETLSDEQRQEGVDLYNQAITGIQKRLGATDPKSPEYPQLQDSLKKAISGRTMLYHPALSRTAQSRLPDVLAAGAPLPAPDDLAGLSPAERQKALRIRAGLDPRATAPKEESENWQTSNVKLKDGTEITLQHNTKSGEWQYLDGKPVESGLLSGAIVAPKAGPSSGSKFNEILVSYEKKWGKKKEDFTPEDFSYINQQIAYDSKVSGSSTATRFEKNDQGQIVPVQYTNTRGLGPKPVDPNEKKQTPAQLRQKVNRPAGAGAKPTAGGPVNVLPPILNAPTPEKTKANNDYYAAIKLYAVAQDVEKKPNDAINQKRLAAALERLSANRFTTQALDYVKQAGWGNTIQEWIQRPDTGALPKDVVRQWVDGARQNLMGAKAARDAAFAAPGTSAPAAGDTTDDEIIKALNK